MISVNDYDRKADLIKAARRAGYNEATAQELAKKLVITRTDLLLVLERLLVSSYTGNDVEGSQEAAKAMLDDASPGWSDKYA